MPEMKLCKFSEQIFAFMQGQFIFGHIIFRMYLMKFASDCIWRGSIWTSIVHQAKVQFHWSPVTGHRMMTFFFNVRSSTMTLNTKHSNVFLLVLRQFPTFLSFAYSWDLENANRYCKGNICSISCRCFRLSLSPSIFLSRRRSWQINWNFTYIYLVCNFCNRLHHAHQSQSDILF